MTQPRDIANALNDTFLMKVSDLRSKTSSDPIVSPSIRLQRFLNKRELCVPELSLRQISITELRNILRKRKGNRSSGIDFIDGYSIKLAAPLIEDILLHLVNLTIEKSEYPQLWKINKVSPHFKKGEKSLGENWRPVTDIVFVSKLAEAVFQQVFEHFSMNKLWHPNQPTAITQLYDIFIRGAENKELTAALLLDLSAAFDVVDPQILLQKMEQYNFSQNSISWFR